MMESWGDNRADMGLTELSKVPAYTPYKRPVHRVSSDLTRRRPAHGFRAVGARWPLRYHQPDSPRLGLGELLSRNDPVRLDIDFNDLAGGQLHGSGVEPALFIQAEGNFEGRILRQPRRQREYRHPDLQAVFRRGSGLGHAVFQDTDVGG